MTQRVDDMTRVLDQNANGLIVALTGKATVRRRGLPRHRPSGEGDRRQRLRLYPDHDGQERRYRPLINDASLNATGAMTRTLGQMQEGALGVTEAAKLTISRTLEELHRATKGAIEESKQTAAATVAEMMETHTMLRSDSTALFERLREANILLQEVLSGAQENMNSIEHTMATRVSEFVAAMSDLSTKSGATTAKVEQHLGTFNNVTAKVLHDLGDLADQFTSHGRTLADAVELLDVSNRRTDEFDRHAAREHRVAGFDTRRANRGFRPAAGALLRPARRIARYRGGAGARNRRHRRREQQRKRAIDRAAIRTRAQDLRRGAAAHQRGAQFDLRRGLRRSAGHVQPNRRPLHRDHGRHEA